MSITRHHVSAKYGPLGDHTPRLSKGRAEAVSSALTSLYADLTHSAAKVLAQHLYRIHLQEPDTVAAEAIEAIGHDFGMAPQHEAMESHHETGGAMLGGAMLGGSLGSWLRGAVNTAKKLAVKAAPYVQAAMNTNLHHDLTTGGPMTKQKLLSAMTNFGKDMATQLTDMGHSPEIGGQLAGAMLGGGYEETPELSAIIKGLAQHTTGGRKARGGAMLGGAMLGGAMAEGGMMAEGGAIHRSPSKKTKGGAMLGGAKPHHASRVRGMTLLDSLQKKKV